MKNLCKSVKSVGLSIMQFRFLDREVAFRINSVRNPYSKNASDNSA